MKTEQPTKWYQVTKTWVGQVSLEISHSNFKSLDKAKAYLKKLYDQYVEADEDEEGVGYSEAYGMSLSYFRFSDITESQLWVIKEINPNEYGFFDEDEEDDEEDDE